MLAMLWPSASPPPCLFLVCVSLSVYFQAGLGSYLTPPPPPSDDLPTPTLTIFEVLHVQVFISGGRDQFDIVRPRWSIRFSHSVPV